MKIEKIIDGITKPKCLNQKFQFSFKKEHHNNIMIKNSIIFDKNNQTFTIYIKNSNNEFKKLYIWFSQYSDIFKMIQWDDCDRFFEQQEIWGESFTFQFSKNKFKSINEAVKKFIKFYKINNNN